MNLHLFGTGESVMSLAVKLLSWNQVRSCGDGEQLVNSMGCQVEKLGPLGT